MKNGPVKLMLVLLLVLSFHAAAHAELVTVALNDDVHFDYDGMLANDFHIEGRIMSANGVPPTIMNIMIFGDPGTGSWTVSNSSLMQIGPDDWMLNIDFVTDGYISYCQWIHFGVDLLVDDYNVILDLCGWWTLDGVAIRPWGAGGPAGEVPVTGFWADDLGIIRPGFQTLRIANDTALSITMPEFEVTISHEPVPLEDMFSTGLGRPGEVSPLYPALEWTPISGLPAVIPPDSFFDIYLEDFGIDIPPGQFLLMRGQQLMEGAVSGDWGWFWEQHGAPSTTTGTIEASYEINPLSGNVPFQIQHRLELFNIDPLTPVRRVAAKIDVTTGNGSFYSNWRRGFTNIAVGTSYFSQWPSTLPASPVVLGNNVFALNAVDVTPAPYNQPPYPPSGDTAAEAVTVVASP